MDYLLTRLNLKHLNKELIYNVFWYALTAKEQSHAEISLEVKQNYWLKECKVKQSFK